MVFIFLVRLLLLFHSKPKNISLKQKLHTKQQATSITMLPVLLFHYLFIFDKSAVCVDIRILTAFEKFFSAVFVSCENEFKLSACGFEVLCKDFLSFLIYCNHRRAGIALNIVSACEF
jgi:hypothetical protein